MKGIRPALVLALAGCLASAPGLAQTAKSAAPEAAKPGAKSSAAAPAEEAKIRRSETIVDDNWTVTCAQTDQPDSKRLCSAALKIAQTDKAGAQRIVFTWVIGRQEGKLASAISVPPGVQIPPGVEIQIGDKEVRKIGYSICMPDHCEALLPLEETVVKSLSAAATTAITVHAVNGAEAKFTVNMKGFAQALADIGK
jgi:invasion protein IalB